MFARYNREVVEPLPTLLCAGRWQKEIASEKRHAINRDFRTDGIRWNNIVFAARELKPKFIQLSRSKVICSTECASVILNLITCTARRGAQSSKGCSSGVRICER